MRKKFDTLDSELVELLELMLEFNNKINGLRYDMEQAVNIPNAVDISLASDEESKKIAKRKMIHYCLGDYM